MLNEHLQELLHYLSVLAQVQGAGHYVNDEIKEAVKAIRHELGLEQKRQKNDKASRFLVYKAQLGKVSFVQNMLFEAVFGNFKDVEFSIEYTQKNEIEKAIAVLEEMKVGKKMRVNEEVETCSVIVSYM